MDSHKVRDVYGRRTDALVIHEDEELLAVITKFAEQPGIRGIFLVDDENIFKGVISRIDLLNFVKAKIGRNRSDLPLKSLLVSRIREAKAIDVCHRLVEVVKPDDDLSKAIDLMIKNDLIDVPVVDEKMRLVGDITLSEALIVLIE